MFKIHDALYIKYGCKPLYIDHAVEHYKVEYDEQVIQAKKQHESEAKSALEAVEKEQELEDDECEMVDEQIKSLLEKSGRVTPDAEGNIPLDRYLEIHVAILTVIHEIEVK